jgi:flagellar hook-associated protein 3 FlgL
MEISTLVLHATPRNAIVELQKKMADAQAEATSGEPANPVKSLGSQFGLRQSLQAQSVSLGVAQDANSLVQSTITASQNALSSIAADANAFTKNLITARSTGDVTSLKILAKSYLASLTSALNTGAGGVYLFAGENSSEKPVTEYSDKAQAATADAFKAEFGFSQSDSKVSSISASDMQAFLAGSYADLFNATNWKKNWSSASDTPTSAQITDTLNVTTSASAQDAAFRQLANAYVAIADLNVDGMGGGARQAVIDNALTKLGFGLKGVESLQATLGTSQSRITNANTQLATQASLIDKWINRMDGIDLNEAVSRVADLATQLETAYSLTNRISKLCLVNFLSA